MRYLLNLLFVLMLFSSCAPNRYLLTDTGKERNHLLEYIKQQKKEGTLGDHPLVVVNGVLYRYTHELKEKGLPLASTDIQQIDVLSKNGETGTNIYGEPAKDGVLLITTQAVGQQPPKPDLSQVLFILEDTPISQEDMKSLNPEEIESIEVIKNKEGILKYSNGDWKGVVIIKLKKK